MNSMRIARAGAIGLVGLALLVIIWIGLAGLSLTGSEHCRDTQGSLLFTDLTGPAGKVSLTYDEERCQVPSSDGTGSWTSPGDRTFDIQTDGEANGTGWLLAERYQWREGYEMTESLAGKVSPALAPLLGLLALVAVVGLVMREHE